MKPSAKKPEKEKYLRRAKELLNKPVKPVKKKTQVSIEPFSHNDKPHGRVWGEFGGPTLQRSNSDPIAAGCSGPLVQRVMPTVRGDVKDLPYSSHGKAILTRPLSPVEKERYGTSAVVGESGSERGSATPSSEYGGSNLHFPSNYASEHVHFLSSTPVPRTRGYQYGQQELAGNAPEQFSTLNAKCSELESRLKVQTDVNKELKRLLVASMGSDLQHRLNQIAEEKATISQDLDTSLQQLAENHEEIDRVSIECDIWRSKFLASRLMIDELAGWKAEVSRQLRECRRALQCMLKEHMELSKAVVQCNHYLNGIGLSFKTRTQNSGLDGGWFSDNSDGSVLEIAKTVAAKAGVIHSQLRDGREPLNTQRGVSVGKATPGEHLAKQVLKSGHQAYTSERNRSPLKLGTEKLQQAEGYLRHSSTSLSQPALNQYLLGSGTQNILFSCNRCKGRIYNL